VAEGRRILAFVLDDPRLYRGGPLPGPGERLIGARRRGKHLVLEAETAAWIVHFRMTGQLVAAAVPGRASWIFEDDAVLTLLDPRRLGTVHGVARKEIEAHFHDLGPEPWPEARDGPWWAARLSGLRGPMKPALMRQDRVAGLGNIAGSEVCWRAGLDPRRPVESLEPAHHAAIARAVPAWIAGALVEADALTYVNQGGPNPFQVYGRAGQPCPRCGTTILRFPQSGRSTFACPACQR
jgi:formamidopyrimidine-DNA glycosylase